jgi:hypothetical protein
MSGSNAASIAENDTPPCCWEGGHLVQVVLAFFTLLPLQLFSELSVFEFVWSDVYESHHKLSWPWHD